MNELRPTILVGFRCPSCAALQGSDIIKLAREGFVPCTTCHRRLNRTQVSRAIERTRAQLALGPQIAPSR